MYSQSNISVPYNSFKNYLRKRFGKLKVYKIPVDAGFTCPNIDGTKSYGGCYYCNNKAFSPNSRTQLLPLDLQIYNSIEYYKKYRKAEKFILYFQAYTNTYVRGQSSELKTAKSQGLEGDNNWSMATDKKDNDKEKLITGQSPLATNKIPDEINFYTTYKLKEIYDFAYKFDDIVGISIGTRPDCVNREILELIDSYTKKFDVWIEYGLQSVHNKTLELVNRAHTYEDFINAIELTSLFPNIKVAAHTIVGLPGESEDEILQTYKSISIYPIDAIKIEHLYIAKDTVFYNWYKSNKIKVYENFNDYLNILGKIITLVSSNWYIQRLIGEINSDYVVAPQWNLSKNQIQQKIVEYFKENNIYQGKFANNFQRI